MSSAVGHSYSYELIHRARSAGEATPWKEARRQLEIAADIDTQLGRAMVDLQLIRETEERDLSGEIEQQLRSRPSGTAHDLGDRN